MYVGGLHENVTGNDLVELLGLRPTNYNKTTTIYNKTKITTHLL